MEITLKAKKGELEITKYTIGYPFSVHAHWKGKEKVLRYVSSLTCKNIQGSFRLYFARKIVFTEYARDNTKTSVYGGNLGSDDHQTLAIKQDTTAKQFISLQKKNFLYVNEKTLEAILTIKNTIYLFG